MDERGSIISHIYRGYAESLRTSQERYQKLYEERARNARLFYERFLKNLLISFRTRFEDEGYRRRLRDVIRNFFEEDEITFVAIDGTAGKEDFADFIVFYTIAYGIRGSVSLAGDPPFICYERYSIEEDKSMVAYVPVPFIEFEDVIDPGKKAAVVSSDTDRIDLSSLHTELMKLAEVYLAYTVAREEGRHRPRLILLDNLPSSLLAHAEVNFNRLGLIGYRYGLRNITKADVIIAYAHPFNAGLELPSEKRFRLHAMIIAALHGKREHKVDLSQLAAVKGIPWTTFERQLRRTASLIQEIGEYDPNKRTLLVRDPKGKPQTGLYFRESWQNTVRFFEDLCHRLFVEKDPEALLYDVPDPEDPSETRARWLSPEDVRFLIAVGLRALVELCWQKRILLVGIAKDSISAYFSRNYLGTGFYAGVYNRPPDGIPLLPWTDRSLLESIAALTSIEAPWATIEFDSVFMTLHIGVDKNTGEFKPMGVRGDILNQERLFARSLAQFFLKRDKATPLMGHVIFIDRLLHPISGWDSNRWRALEIETEELGKVRPFFHKDASDENLAQAVMMFLLDTITQNVFPEAIGYPTPLHKADWGAKTVGRQLKGMIEGSEIAFRARPLAKLFRTLRDAARR